jgi:hypothetical protein
MEETPLTHAGYFAECSESVDKLVAALVSANANGLSNVGKDARNPHFGNKYATLAAIVEAVAPALHKAGLAVVQLVTGPGRVKTVLCHTSGQYISAEVELPPVKGDPQAAGSAITYARRYALPAILGIATDEDDDGNAASAGKQEQQRAAAPVSDKPHEPAPAPPLTAGLPTIARNVEFNAEMGSLGKQLVEVLKASGVESPRDDAKLRLANLLSGHGFKRLADVHDEADQAKVYAAWHETVEMAKQFYANGGAK